VPHRAFIDQRGERRPGRRIQHGNRLEATTGPPRRSRPALRHHLNAQEVEVRLDLAVRDPESRQRVDQLPGRIQCGFFVQRLPADLKHANQVLPS